MCEPAIFLIHLCFLIQIYRKKRPVASVFPPVSLYGCGEVMSVDLICSKTALWQVELSNWPLIKTNG